MEQITKEEFRVRRDYYHDKIRNGKVFIHPTDTIYGLGCNALNSKAAKKIREIKKRTVMPFSVIIPSKKWIYDNCEVPQQAIKWVEKLPGPYTLIFKLKKRNAIVKEVNSGWGTIGVRIPQYWFAKEVAILGFPVVSTSANISGEDFMTTVEDLNPKIGAAVDFIIYEGPKKGRPSTIVNCVEEEIEITRR